MRSTPRRPKPNSSPRRGPAASTPTVAPEALTEEEAGALRIGPTDHGMVRLMLTTHGGAVDLDFSPDEAREIAAEMMASADLAEGGQAGGR